MKLAQVILICGVILSYLLPWHIYIVEWESNPNGAHPGIVMIPIRSTYPSGFRLSVDLAMIAHKQWYIEGSMVDDGVTYRTYPVRGRAMWTALYAVLLLLPLLVAAVSLVRVVRSRRTRRIVGPWLAAALMILAVTAFLVSGNPPGTTWVPTPDIIRSQGTHNPVFPTQTTLWGPLIFLAFSVTLAGLWIAETIRRRRGHRVSDSAPPPTPAQSHPSG